MEAVAFALAFGALTTFIHFAGGCGNIPASEDDLLSYYETNTKCEIYPDLPNVFKPDKLLVNCNGRQADISITSTNEYVVTLVAMCMQPDGNCSVQDVDMWPGISSAEINLPANFTDCLFGACANGEDDDENIIFPLSSCAVHPETTSTIIAPTSTSTISQQTAGVVDAPSIVEPTTLASVSTFPQLTSGGPTELSGTTLHVTKSAPDKRKPLAAIISSAVSIIVLTAAILILILAILVFRARKPVVKHWVLNNTKFDATFQPVTIEVSMKISESLGSNLSDYTFLHAHDRIKEVPLKLNNSYRQNMFTATTPAKVHNETLAQEVRKVTVRSVSNDYHKQGEWSDKNTSELKQSSFSNSSSADSGIKEDMQGYITSEPKTDNLPSSTLTPFNVDSYAIEMLDEDTSSSITNEQSTDNLPPATLPPINVDDNANEVLDEDTNGYITNERSTDNLPPATLPPINVANEVLDEDTSGYITNEQNAYQLLPGSLTQFIIDDNAREVLDEDTNGYITNERSTDNLPPATLPPINVDEYNANEVLDEDTSGYITNEQNADQLLPGSLTPFIIDDNAREVLDESTSSYIMNEEKNGNFTTVTPFNVDGITSEMLSNDSLVVNTDHLPPATLTPFSMDDYAMEVLDKSTSNYIKNEQSTDNLPPATLTLEEETNANEMFDEGNYMYGQSMLSELDANEDHLNIEDVLLPPGDYDQSEHVQEDDTFLFVDDGMQDSGVCFIPKYMDQHDTSSSYCLPDISSNQSRFPPTDSDNYI